jgi:phosphohistidine phosphatase SixA
LLGKRSELLAELLAESGAPDRILSSPAERCRQTVAPLAKQAGRDVELEEWLDEGSDALEALALLTELEEAVVAACTHGDVIWGVLDWLARGGVDLGARPDASKASTWALDWPDSPAEGVPIRAGLEASWPSWVGANGKRAPTSTLSCSRPRAVRKFSSCRQRPPTNAPRRRLSGQLDGSQRSVPPCDP